MIGIHDHARAWAIRTGWTDARGRGTTDGPQSILVLDAWRRAGAPKDPSPEYPAAAQAAVEYIAARESAQPALF